MNSDHSQKQDSNAPKGDVFGSGKIAATTPQEVKKGHKTIIVIAIALGLVMAITIAGIVWFVLQTNNTQTNDTSTETSQAFYEDTVSAALGEVDGERIFASTVTSLGGQTDDGRIVYDFAPYKVQGKSFKSLPVTGTGFAKSVPANTAEENYQGLVKFFSDNKNRFEQMSASGADAGGLAVQSDTVTIRDYRVYVSQDAVCTVARLSAAGSDQQAISVGCASVSSYKTSAAAAKPFYEVAGKSDASKNIRQVMGEPDISDGKDGYKRAFVYQQGTDSVNNGLFMYYKKGDAMWQLVGQTPQSGVIPCSLFTTADQKAAFNGVGCETAPGQLSRVH